jgi:hypothetical protein
LYPILGAAMLLPSALHATEPPLVELILNSKAIFLQMVTTGCA